MQNLYVWIFANLRVFSRYKPAYISIFPNNFASILLPLSATSWLSLFFLHNPSPIRTHCLCANATTVLQEILLRQRNDYTEKLPFSVTFMQHPPPPPHHYRCPHHPFILIVQFQSTRKEKSNLKLEKTNRTFIFRLFPSLYQEKNLSCLFLPRTRKNQATGHSFHYFFDIHIYLFHQSGWEYTAASWMLKYIF